MASLGEIDFANQVVDEEPTAAAVESNGGAAAVAAALSTPSEEVTEEFEEETSEDSGPELSEFGLDFLSHVPEEHRAIVGQYLSPWDAGAQRRFQRYQEQIDQFAQLGEYEELQRGQFLLRQLHDSPETFLTNLQGIVNKGQPQQPQSIPQDKSSIAEQLGVPEAFLGDVDPQAMKGLQMLTTMMDRKYGQQLTQQQQAIEAMRGMLTELNERDRQWQESTRLQTEQQKLEQELGLLERQYGGFDRTFVLGQIQAGRSPDEAVQAFKAMRQAIINEVSTAPKVTPTLSGSGAPPAQQEPDVTKMSDKQVRQMVANMLAQSGDEE